MAPVDCLIGIGSNQGDSHELIRRTVADLQGREQIESVNVSSFHTTRAIGGPSDQAEFVNAAAHLCCTLSPTQLHQLLVAIEQTLGRVRITRWGPRKIDLDLLLHGRVTLNDAELIVPHPRMTFRRFVMMPAAEVAADMIHPESGCTIAAYCRHLESADRRVLVRGGSEDYQTALIEATNGLRPSDLSVEREAEWAAGPEASGFPLLDVVIAGESTGQPAAGRGDFDAMKGQPIPRLRLAGQSIAADCTELTAAMCAILG